MQCVVSLVFLALALLCVAVQQCEAQSKRNHERSKYYRNVWAVKVDGSLEVVESIAVKCGFQKMRPVSQKGQIYSESTSDC